jgi:DNA-binding winged helix-turn-helix (wHTH) protein/tetratricopeptide (TPR) repeat protein
MNDLPTDRHAVPATHEALRFGEFELRLAPLALFRNGRPVKLQRQPLKLLALLASRGGAVATHDDIRASLWPGRTVDFAGGTHVCVRQIRQALGDQGDCPKIIENVSGTGYRFLPAVEAIKVRRGRGRRMAAIAAAVLAALVVGLVLVGLPQTGRESSAAFGAYARGQFLLEQRDPDAAKRSLHFFERAIAADPAFAPARLGAAEAHLRLKDFGAAEREARAALVLDVGLAEGHLVLGEAALRGGWQWRDAAAHFSAALTIDYGFARAHQGLAAAAMLQGDTAAALDHMAQAQRLDPGSTLIHADHGWMSLASGDSARAARLCAEALELQPSSLDARICLIRSLSAAGRHDEALSHAVVVMSTSGANTREIAAVASDLERSAIAFETWRLARYERPGRSDRASAALLADIHAFVGNHETALGLLERAVAEHIPSAPLTAIGPAFRPLAADARYRRLLARMGVALPTQS